MGRVKLSEIDKSNLKNFLKYDDKKINKDWIIKASSINIVLFLLAAYLEGYRSVLAIVLYIICAIILTFLIIFLRRNEHDKKNLYLHFGIYTCLLSVSSGVLSYALLKRAFGERCLAIIVSMICLSLIVAIITYCVYIRKISNNYYENNKIVQSVNTGAIVCGILAVRQLELSSYVVFGSCFGIIAIASARNIHFIIKYYCHCLLEADNR